MGADRFGVAWRGVAWRGQDNDKIRVTLLTPTLQSVTSVNVPDDMDVGVASLDNLDAFRDQIYYNKVTVTRVPLQLPLWLMISRVLVPGRRYGMGLG
jgi:hypothetical protein